MYIGQFVIIVWTVKSGGVENEVKKYIPRSNMWDEEEAVILTPFKVFM